MPMPATLWSAEICSGDSVTVNKPPTCRKNPGPCPALLLNNGRESSNNNKWLPVI